MSRKNGSVLVTRLRNGLEVRLKEIHTAPIVSSRIWYRVGSRNEVAGITGASHWVEHMLFKGTPTYPAGKIHREFARVGGMTNANTWLDWTCYFESVPRDALDLALHLEADRMINSEFDPKEVAAERNVIISERQGYENEPAFRLMEQVQATAFRVHAYHHEVIGDMADLERMTREELYRHYRTYYVPGNAVLTIAGDFKTRPLLDRIRETFGQIPKASAPRTHSREEPPQAGERRVTVEGPGETTYVQVAYHTPAAKHEDFIPLTVLDSVLAGASNFSFYGSGISNKTSRLYLALVESELAAGVNGSLYATMDPFLYWIQITMRPGRDPGDALARFDEEIERMLHDGVDQNQLAKAVKQAKALFAYNSESITNQAFWLGFSEMFADYSWFEGYLDRLDAMTPQDVLEVARRYLLPSNRVVGIYRSAEGGSIG